MQIDLNTLRGFFRAAPFMAHLGIEPTEASVGRVSTVLAIAPHLLQHTGQVHAGVTTSLADHSMGAAAQTMAPDDCWVITAELKVSLLRPAVGERLVCEASVIKPGKLIMFTEAEVWAEATGKPRQLVVKASATMALVPARK